MEKLDAFSRVVHKSKVSVKKIIYKVFKFVMVCLKPHTSTSQDPWVCQLQYIEEELCCMGKQKLA